MFQSSSETTAASPTPISPFSSYSGNSEATSDELPDLGAFTTVFRALGHLQPPRTLTIPNLNPTTVTADDQPTTAPSSSVLLSLSDPQDSDAQQGSTVWSRPPIASYLNPMSSHDNDTTTDRSHSPNPSEDDGFDPGSDTEGEPEHDDQANPADENEEDDASDVEPAEQPSLGYLDDVLSFLAAERARYAAEREAGTKGSENAWKHVVEPRRRRRRKRTGTKSTSDASTGVQILRSNGTLGTGETATTTADHDADTDDADADDSSSSFGASAAYFKSTPSTPPRKASERRKQRNKAVDDNPRLTHSRSTPSLRSLVNGPPDPRVIGLRKLAHKLRMLFPADAAGLSRILSSDRPQQSDDFVDPRGPVPQTQDTLIHVFIDHSNILIGFLTYLKRYKHLASKKVKHMSHAALALILERGRPITRRVLVTSSPLYQPMDTAEQLGYEVRVYARVPDMGDGADRRGSADSAGHRRAGSGEATGKEGNGRGWRKARGHSHKGSNGGNTSTESEQGGSSNGVGFPQAFIRSLGAPSSSSTRPLGPQIPSSSSTVNVNNTTPASTRVRYREQGVDELLQLKLHQAIADVDVPPPNATIVLATGDGNVGQFNEDGFLGPVRTALKKGWRVELYAWEEGLSRAWMREFGEGPWKDRFRVIGMEEFGADLLEI